MAAGDYQLIKHVDALMKALEDGAFLEAEALIRDAWHPDCLNAYDRRSSPLFLVLSGKAGYFNLYLADLLVQYGADLSNRDSLEVSPLESAIKLYLHVKALSEIQEPSDSILIIGLNGEINPPLLKLKEQLSVLIDFLLASGANPNSHQYLCKRSIFHGVVAFKNTDVDMVMKLYRRGCNFNEGDRNGTTPLMDCITVTKRDQCLPLVDKILREVTELDLNHTNHMNETMFSRALAAGSPTIAMHLLQNGADPTIDVKVMNKSGDFIDISPIFAPLLRRSPLYTSLLNISGMGTSFSIPRLNKVMLCSVFPVIDCTDLCDILCAKLEQELSLKTKFPWLCLTDEEYHSHDVAVLILGHFKAGLQQLCVRRIMEHLIVKQPCLWRDIVKTGTYRQESLVKQLCPVIIGILRRKLGLPPRVERRFFIEAARLQMGSCFFWY